MIAKNIEVLKLDDFGRGIGYFNNKIVFINDTLTGEIVNIKITKEVKKYYEADVVKYLKISDKRIKPICPYFNECGGCSLMHLSYEDQLKYKEEKVKRKLKNITPIIFDKNTNYRNKVTLKVNNNIIGFYKKNSNKLIAIDYCYLLDDKINDLIKIIKEKIDLSNINEIMIRTTLKDTMVVFFGKKIDKRNLLQLKNNVTSIFTYDNDYELVYGKKQIEQELNGIKLLISPGSFLQVNTTTCLKMYNKINELINNCNELLDLYCGVGSIGLYVSNKCKKVIGVEINSSAIEDANKNKQLNKIKNASFYNMNANEINKEIKEKFDYVIVDPPRSGLDKKTIQYLIDSNAQMIIYVSCDLMTLTRDINQIKEKYEIIEITPIDMFPNTYHVECVCVLKLH